MLPAAARLRRRSDFQVVLRSGRRRAAAPLVLHVLTDAGADRPAQVGFVIGRPVGGAVVRNRLRRRLQHLLRTRLGGLPRGTRVVVRALPGAGELDSAALAPLLDTALARAAS